MEDKQRLDTEVRGKTHMKYLGISVLVLSLLLGACVVSLIYMSLQPAFKADCNKPAEETRVAEQRSYESSDSYQSQSQQQQSQTVKDEAKVNMKEEDGSEYEEDIEYDEDRDVAFFYGPNGYFSAEDYDKGINVIRDQENGFCYVVPVGSNRTAGQEMKTFVKGYTGQEVDVHEGQSYKVDVLPGAIQDRSFLPPEADQKCSDYYWLAVVGEDTDTEDDAARKKRAVCRYRYCRYYLINGYIYRYCYYRYFTC
jgi:hypothetical protein